MKVWGWPADTGGCAWYRINTPLGSLEATDDVQIGVVMPNSILDEPDRLVVLQRSTTPPAMMVLDEFQRKGRPWVYDIDDLLWDIPADNPAHTYYSDRVRRERLAWHLTNAPLLTVSTSQLADEAKVMGAKRIAVVPNVLPQHMWDEAPKIVERDGPVTIFWRGSPTHAKDVPVLRYALRKISKLDDVRIVLAGTDYRKELGIPNAEFLPWQPDPESYIRSVAALAPDITLCPLNHTRFNRTKSHVNALEAAYAGARVIASDVPAYQSFAQHVHSAVTVPYAEQRWYEAIRDAVEDPPDAHERRSTRKAASIWTTDLLADQYRDLLAQFVD